MLYVNFFLVEQLIHRGTRIRITAAPEGGGFRHMV